MPCPHDKHGWNNKRKMLEGLIDLCADCPDHQEEAPVCWVIYRQQLGKEGK